jgi:hypothetical protein
MWSARKITIVLALLVGWGGALGEKAIPLVRVFGAAAMPATSKSPEVGGKVLGACAAFGADGGSAAVTFDAANVALDISSASGQDWHLNLPLLNKEQITLRSQSPGEPNSCDVYFDHADDLVAVCIDELQIAVAELKTMKWVGNWQVEADTGIALPSLAGFLQQTRSLVVAGELPAQGGKGTHWGLYATALFDPSGKQLAPLHVQRYAPDGHMFRRFADPKHDLLWVFRCEPVDAPMSRQPLCPIVSMSLTGSQQSLSEFAPSTQGRKRTDLWFYPRMLVAPDSSLIEFGEGTHVWTVDLRRRMIDLLAFPRQPHFPQFEYIEGRATLAPDGQAMAIAVGRSRLAFPFLVDNYVFQGTDIAIIQTNPLRFLGLLRYGRTAYAPAFAIDHHQGRITVLMYCHDRWERAELHGFSDP